MENTPGSSSRRGFNHRMRRVSIQKKERKKNWNRWRRGKESSSLWMKKDSPLILVSCCYRLLCYICFTHAKQTDIPVVSFASPSSWEGTHWSSTVFLVRGFPLLCFHFSFLWNRIEWSNKMRRRETIDLRSTLFSHSLRWRGESVFHTRVWLL